MRVGHQHRLGAAGEGAVDGGVDLLGHQPPRPLVLGVAGLALQRGHHPGHPLDVGGDENPHGAGLSAWRNPGRT